MNKLFEEVNRIVKANDYLNSDRPSNYRREEAAKPDEDDYPRLIPGGSISAYWEAIDKWRVEHE